MGIGVGAIKYILYTPLTIVGFICMYIFGGTIVTFFNTLGQLFSGNFINAFLEYFVYSALPPTSISHIFIQVLIGTLVAGSKWFFAMAIRGFPL
jgi:hypothetical protein